MAEKKKEPRFEDALAKLEEIVEKLESEETPLEDAIRLYEQGAQLITACEKKLALAESKLKKVIPAADGSPDEQELELPREE